MRRLLRRLEKLEASPAAQDARFCPGCWGISFTERYADDPEPPHTPCPVCNDTNPPPDDGVIRIVNIIFPGSSRSPQAEADQDSAREATTAAADWTKAEETT